LSRKIDNHCLRLKDKRGKGFEKAQDAQSFYNTCGNSKTKAESSFHENNLNSSKTERSVRCGNTTFEEDINPNFARLSKCHCEKRSGCEAKPKQTRSLSLITEKYNGLTSQKLRFLATLGTGSAIPSPKDCFAIARNDRNGNAF